MITITIAPVTPAQVAAVTKLLQDYPVLTPLENFKTEAAPKTAPRASSAKASPAPAQEAQAPQQPEPTLVTLEAVRAKLTDISQGGKKTEVSALIAEFGAKKLTDVKPEDYAALLAKAEKL